MKQEQTTIICDRCDDVIVFNERFDLTEHAPALANAGWQIIRVGFNPEINSKRHLCGVCYQGFVNYIESGWVVTPDSENEHHTDESDTGYHIIASAALTEVSLP